LGKQCFIWKGNSTYMNIKFGSKLILAITTLILISLSNAFAGSITIFDNRTSGTATNTWYNQGNSPGEDQEVEPGMIANQYWDLEAFFLNGNMLSMVGGFNFQYGYSGLYSGDIFLDTTGDAKYGDAGASLQNGYDYVVTLNRTANGTLNGTYNVYSLIGGSLLDVYSYNSYESSPWRYIPGTNSISLASGNLTFTQSADGQGTHYTLDGIDLSFLPAGTTFISHFTFECGNDNLMGQGTTVPEPGTLILLGSGLVAAVTLRRKIRK
jgi:hypothetical protein